MENEIDLTKVLEDMQSTFVLSAKAFLTAAVLSALHAGPVAAWFLNVFLGPALEFVLKKLSTWVLMQSFFMLALSKKKTEAYDYVKSVQAKKVVLQDRVYDAKAVELAEKNEMDAFTRLVRLTS